MLYWKCQEKNYHIYGNDMITPGTGSQQACYKGSYA